MDESRKGGAMSRCSNRRHIEVLKNARRKKMYDLSTSKKNSKRAVKDSIKRPERTCKLNEDVAEKKRRRTVREEHILLEVNQVDRSFQACECSKRVHVVNHLPAMVMISDVAMRK